MPKSAKSSGLEKAEKKFGELLPREVLCLPGNALFVELGGSAGVGPWRHLIGRGVCDDDDMPFSTIQMKPIQPK